jgi:hypothetical protein
MFSMTKSASASAAGSGAKRIGPHGLLGLFQSLLGEVVEDHLIAVHREIHGQAAADGAGPDDGDGVDVHMFQPFRYLCPKYVFFTGRSAKVTAPATGCVARTSTVFVDSGHRLQPLAAGERIQLDVVTSAPGRARMSGELRCSKTAPIDSLTITHTRALFSGFP